jgi:leucyl aminopeptidase
MKFDMSGAAAVLEAVGAIAALELPVDLVGSSAPPTTRSTPRR